MRPFTRLRLRVASSIAPGLEVDEELPHPRIDGEIADRVVVVVAGVVGKDEPLVALRRHEAGISPAMRSVHAEGRALPFSAVTAGDEDGVGVPDPLALFRG